MMDDPVVVDDFLRYLFDEQLNLRQKQGYENQAMGDVRYLFGTMLSLT